MNRIPLDIYEDDLMSREQKIYLMRNGWHFSKQAYEYAASYMRKINKATGKLVGRSLKYVSVVSSSRGAMVFVSPAAVTTGVTLF